MQAEGGGRLAEAEEERRLNSFQVFVLSQDNIAALTR